MKKEVTGLGQCSLDHIAYASDYPAEDMKEEVEGLYTEGGGPVATALVSLSRLGVKTNFMGRISDDPAGSLIRKGLKEEGVDTRGLRVKKGGKSQEAFIVVNKSEATRTIFWQRPTTIPLQNNEVNKNAIKRSAMLLLDGLMHDASLHAARIARAAGVPVMLDAGSLREGTLALAAQSDYIVCSERLAHELSGTPSRAIKELAKLKPRAITITLGKEGSITWHEGKKFKTPALKVKALDTTGAGDVFHGGYIYGLLKGWKLEKTVRFASAFAALKCTKPGGRSGIPTLNKTLKYMRGK